MTFDISFSDKDVSVDPVACLFRASAVMSDHVTRLRQNNLHKDVDLGQGLKGKVVAIDYKTVTLKGTNGEQRTVPISSKRAALLSQGGHAAPKSSTRRSPRPQVAGTTTRK